MNILEKIERIRQQPEAVRLRYVWLCVSVAMFFVFAIWIISLQTNFPRVETETPLTLPTITNTVPTPDPGTAQPDSASPSLQDILKKPDQPQS